MKRNKNFLLYIIIIVGLFGLFASIFGFNILRNKNTYLIGEIREKYPEAVVLDDYPLIIYVKDMCVTAGLHRTLSKYLLLVMVVLLLVHIFYLYKGRNKK